MPVDSMIPVLFFGAIIVLVVAGAIASHLAEKRRRKAFLDLAERLGLTYIERDTSIPRRYDFFNKLCQGSNRYAFNVLDGVWQGHPVTVFDYHYETYSRDSKGRRQTHHHYFSFFMLRHELHCPELIIAPETFLSKIGQMLGFDDIDFESHAFSKAFLVRSPDRKFAFDICHTRMMEYLLANSDLSIEIERDHVSLFFDKRLEPEGIEAGLRKLLDIRGLFPEYLYRA
jgi:hypothetical protein